MKRFEGAVDDCPVKGADRTHKTGPENDLLGPGSGRRLLIWTTAVSRSVHVGNWGVGVGQKVGHKSLSEVGLSEHEEPGTPSTAKLSQEQVTDSRESPETEEFPGMWDF